MRVALGRGDVVQPQSTTSWHRVGGRSPLKSRHVLASVALGGFLIGACQEPDPPPPDVAPGDTGVSDATALDMDVATLDMDVAGACCQACTRPGTEAVFCRRCEGFGVCDWIDPFVIDGEVCDGLAPQRLCGCLLTIFTHYTRCDVVNGVVVLSGNEDICDRLRQEMVCGWPPGRPRPPQ